MADQAGQNDPGPDSWKRPQSVDVTKYLVIEKNAIAIEGTNTIPGPSGLLVKLMVEFEDGDDIRACQRQDLDQYGQAGEELER